MPARRGPPAVVAVGPAVPVGVSPPPGVLPAEVAGGGGGGGGGVPSGRDYDYYITEGARLQEIGRSAEARRFFERALDLRAGGAEALTGLGYCALDQRDWAGAISRFREPASHGYGDAMMGMGDAYRGSGRSVEAIAAYREYLARSPNGSQARMARHAIETLGGDAAPTPPANPSGGGGTGGGTEPTPNTPPSELPAPVGTTTPPPSSDTPAVGTE